MFAIHVTVPRHRPEPVQEYSGPAAFEVPATAALPDAVTAHAAATPDHVAFSRTVGATGHP